MKDADSPNSNERATCENASDARVAKNEPGGQQADRETSPGQGHGMLAEALAVNESTSSAELRARTVLDAMSCSLGMDRWKAELDQLTAPLLPSKCAHNAIMRSLQLCPEVEAYLNAMKAWAHPLESASWMSCADVAERLVPADAISNQMSRWLRVGDDVPLLSATQRLLDREFETFDRTLRSLHESLGLDRMPSFGPEIRTVEALDRLLSDLRASEAITGMERLRGVWALAPDVFDLSSTQWPRKGDFPASLDGLLLAPGPLLSVPEVPPFRRADVGTDSSMAPAGDIQRGVIVAPGSADLNRAVLLELARQCGWDWERLLRVLAEMRGARVEMPRPTPERTEPPVHAQSRRSRSGKARGGVNIRDQGGALEVGFRGEVRIFKKLKGLLILKILTDRPDQFISCLDLRIDSAAASVPRALVGENESAARLYGLPEGYDRLKDLREEIEEAGAHSDWRKKEELEEQQEDLIRQLAAEGGGGVHGTETGQRVPGSALLGGRSKGRRHKAVSPELSRARIAVLATIKYAYEAIKPELPRLEQHLRERVQTGNFCRYLKFGEKD